MNSNTNYGIILKTIRVRNDLSVRNFAKKIGRSAGWLSEIENNTGTARLSTQQFERLIKDLGVERFKNQFRTWVANYKNSQKVDRKYDGAILRYVRLKKNLTLREVANKSDVPTSIISKVENGSRIANTCLRNKILKACGYSAESFKNFATDPVRSKVIPDSYKLQILQKQLSESQLSHLFQVAQQLIKETSS